MYLNSGVCSSTILEFSFGFWTFNNIATLAGFADNIEEYDDVTCKAFWSLDVAIADEVVNEAGEEEVGAKFSLLRFEIPAFLFFRLLCFLTTGVNMSSVDWLVCKFNMAAWVANSGEMVRPEKFKKDTFTQ